MSEQLAYAGNKGEKIRSDCHVTLEVKDSGGLQIDLDSKVQPLYGASIHELCEDILRFFDFQHARLQLVDAGAIPLVIAARLEAAIRKLKDTDREYLMPLIEENKYGAEKEQFRFSRLYLPGNMPKMMLNAGIHHPNGVILDLEDSVAPDRKHEARFLIRNALRGINFYGAERMVRINQLPV